MAISSKTELMKEEINQTGGNETCSFQAAYHQPPRVDIWGTDGCCRLGTARIGGKKNILSVKFGFAINIKVTRAASAGFFTLVCFLLVFLKQQINPNAKPGRAFRELHPKR